MSVVVRVNEHKRLCVMDLNDIADCERIIKGDAPHEWIIFHETYLFSASRENIERALGKNQRVAVISDVTADATADATSGNCITTQELPRAILHNAAYYCFNENALRDAIHGCALNRIYVFSDHYAPDVCLPGAFTLSYTGRRDTLHYALYER